MVPPVLQHSLITRLYFMHVLICANVTQQIYSIDSVHHAQKASSYMSETLLDPITGHSDQDTHAAFQRAFGVDVSMWEWLERPENEEDLKMVSVAMRGASKLLPTDGILKGMLADMLRVSRFIDIFMVN